MKKPEFVAHVRTGRFNFTEVQPHFINPCCFGEDFAAWLRGQLAPLAAHGFELSDPIQEDYGWGLWVSRDKARIWIALSAMQDGEDAAPPTEGEWMVSVAEDHGLNPLKALFARPDMDSFAQVAAAVRDALARAPDIAVSPDDRT